MANTYTRLVTHAVFSTRNRRPYLVPAIEEEIYQYLGGTVNALGGQSIVVNGYRDHVHCLFFYPPTVTLSWLIQELKKASTGWVQDHFSRPYFRWQEGFGAFSVDHRDMRRVVQYIENQKQHHQGHSYKDEYKALLKEYEVEFDERYVVEPEHPEDIEPRMVKG